MIRFYYIFFLLLIPGFLFAAPPKLEVTQIQTLHPPIKNLNLSDNLNIAIVANIYNDTRPDSLIKINYPTDSLLAVKAAFALKYRLEESPTFTDYDFPVYNFKRTDSKLLQEGITIGDALSLAEDVQANYLITVDIVNISLWYEVGVYDKGKTELIYAGANAPFHFIFRVYDIINNKMLDVQPVADTFRIIIDALPFEANQMVLLEEIVDNRNPVVEASEQAGGIYADVIALNWVEEDRYFYNDRSKEMKQAVKLVQEQKWTEAMELWSEKTELADMERAAAACFNMALGCEMIGDYELALEWLKLAVKKNPKIKTDEFEKLIQRRMSEKALIEKIVK